MYPEVFCKNYVFKILFNEVAGCIIKETPTQKFLGRDTFFTMHFQATNEHFNDTRIASNNFSPVPFIINKNKVKLNNIAVFINAA